MEITSVIKYEGDNSTFVWKHPKEDFNTESQLIVHETQEAVFFLNGQPLDLFTSGRYTLETANIPILQKIKNIPTNGVSPFHCEVYFVNKTEQMGIRWGTDSTVQYIEPTYGFPISIGANGEMSLKAVDSKKLLLKLVGTESDLTQESLTTYFRSFLMARVKSYIAQSTKENKISIFELDERLVEFSEDLKAKLLPDFDDYGISLEKFFVTSVAKPDGTKQYEEFKNLFYRQYSDVAAAKIRQQVGIIDQETEAKKMVIEAEGIAKKRSTEGYTYQQERGFDVAEKIAENEGAGNFSSAGIGLGMMTGIGGTIGGVVSETVGGAVANIAPKVQCSLSFCDNCGAKLVSGAFFCEECGTKVAMPLSCVNCGYVFERPGKFCPKCGTKRSDV